MKNIKVLIICIIIPLLVGFVSNLLGNSASYSTFNKPFLSPPGIVFPIVWTILYILMGISSYIIYTSSDKNKNKALTIYGVQLFVNMFWTFFFFNLRWYLFSFIWILLLIGLVSYMIYLFYKIDKKAGLFQVPYLIWLVFASYLNIMIFILN